MSRTGYTPTYWNDWDTTKVKQLEMKEIRATRTRPWRSPPSVGLLGIVDVARIQDPPIKVPRGFKLGTPHTGEPWEKMFTMGL